MRWVDRHAPNLVVGCLFAVTLQIGIVIGLAVGFMIRR